MGSVRHSEHSLKPTRAGFCKELELLLQSEKSSSLPFRVGLVRKEQEERVDGV